MVQGQWGINVTHMTMLIGGVRVCVNQILENIGLENPLSVESSLSTSEETWKVRMLREVQTMEAWLVTFQRRAKPLPDR